VINSSLDADYTEVTYHGGEQVSPVENGTVGITVELDLADTPSSLARRQDDDRNT